MSAAVPMMASIVGVSACFAPAPGERAEGSCWSDPDPFVDCSDAAPPACPAYEVCSDRTPNGLWFSGARLGDELDLGGTYGPLVTAVGGTQDIHIHALAGWPFDARGGDAFDAMAGVGDDAIVTGRARGADYLRIVEPGTELLYDRIILDVADAATIDIRGTFDWIIALDEAPPPVVWWAGVEHTVVVALSATDGTRVVDEDIELSAAGLVPGDAWDRWTLSAAIVADTIPVAVTMSDGTRRSTSMRLVSSVDDIAVVDNGYFATPDDGLRVGQERTFCFRAVNAGAMILDAPMTASSDAPISVGVVHSGCVDIEGVSAGTGHVTVGVGTRTRTFAIPVTTTAAFQSQRKARDETDRALRGGERASARQ